MAGGRPTKYNKQLAEEICNAIACSSKGLFYLCKNNENFPDRDTVYRWIGAYPEFHDMYARAKMRQADYMAEEIIEISDNSSNDIKHTENGEIINTEYVQRSRLRVDTRKWLASKLYPRVYGDKVQTEMSGNLNIDVSKLSDEELRKIIEDKSSS